MADKLKVDDFEVVPDPGSHAGCENCFFQDFETGCHVFETGDVGRKLEEKHGSCFDEPEHYYKLKSKK